MNAIEESARGVHVRVRVQPRSSRESVQVEPDGRIRVALTAPPVHGAANKALVALMAKKLGIAKGAVRVVRGEKSREKTLAVEGITAAAVRKRLWPG